MPRRVLDEFIDRIVRTIAGRSESIGYERRRLMLKKTKHGNAAIIEFQRSQTSTSETVTFTVNLAVVCGALLDPEMLSIDEAKSIDGHLRVRIGTIMPQLQDMWWTISSGSDFGRIEADVVGAVCNFGIPYVEQHLSDAALIQLWDSGKAPGLTEVQRTRNLRELRRSAQRTS